jgi:hypothetical protein
VRNEREPGGLEAAELVVVGVGGVDEAAGATARSWLGTWFLSGSMNGLTRSRSARVR